MVQKKYYNNLEKMSFNLNNSDTYHNDLKECIERDEREKCLNLVLKVFYEEIEEYSNCEDLYVLINKSDIKEDIYVDKNYYRRTYGIVVDCKNILYRDVLVRLFRYKFCNGSLRREEIDRMFTNHFGEFNFVILNPDRSYEYKVEIDPFYKI